MKAVALTNEMVNEVITGIYGQEAVLTFIEEMEMDAVVVYENNKIKRIVEMEDVLVAMGNTFNQTFVSFDMVDMGELGMGYVFHVPVSPARTTLSSCA